MLLFAFVAYAVSLAFVLKKQKRLERSFDAQTMPAATNIAEQAALPSVAVADRIAAWTRISDAVLEARTLADRGDFEQAEQRIRRALEDCPQSLRLQTTLAQLYISRQKHAAAEPLLVNILEVNPDDLKVRAMLASVLAAQTNWAAALRTAQWILDTDPSSSVAHEIAADAYLATDRVALAVPHLKKLVSLQRKNVVAQNKLGRAYATLGDYAKAIQTFNDVLAQNANDATAHYNLAACYAQQGLTEQAAEVLSRAAARFGENFVAAWIVHPDFDTIRTNRIIIALLENWRTWNENNSSAQ